MLLVTAPADAAVPAVAPQTEGAAPDDRALRALFDRARDGDGAALDALCRAMRPRLFRVALAVLRDADDADDVAQEALVRAVTRRLLFLGTGSVGGWMTRIALNLAKNRRRDGRRRAAIVAQAPPSDLGARGAVASAPPRPDERLLDDEQRRRLRAALPTLPERQRDVMQLRAVAGLDFAAVAATLEITEANARMTFSLAKKKLQALVADPVDAAAPATAAPATAAPATGAPR
ncbi:MAG: sigma-70 family RNA polymerase sigma factor [Deltaproteobacteria bacterium]|nr:sigma-70 family RNA polymerase sigma factor [Deltaproteobacteria bacterium]